MKLTHMKYVELETFMIFIKIKILDQKTVTIYERDNKNIVRFAQIFESLFFLFQVTSSQKSSFS